LAQALDLAFSVAGDQRVVEPHRSLAFVSATSDRSARCWPRLRVRDRVRCRCQCRTGVVGRDCRFVAGWSGFLTFVRLPHRRGR
jgi:hypothetical protein